MSNPTYVTVCDQCLRSSCWQGVFMCAKSTTAGTTDLDISYLKARKLEHTDWLDDPEGAARNWANCT